LEGLKKKTTSGFIWSLVDAFAGQGIQFIAFLILARLLGPHEFGLLGILTIFVAVAQTLIDAGFSQALIRKTDCTDNDYSTVFWLNILIGLLVAGVVVILADRVALFFEDRELVLPVKWIGFCVFVNSTTLVHRAILAKSLDFKTSTLISFVSGMVSSGTGVWMGYLGYGIWSLVVMTIVKFVISALGFWIMARWRPAFVFVPALVPQHFKFGGNLLVSSMIDTIYRNAYLVVVAKFFSAEQLGYYTRADQFQALPSQNLSGIVSRVSYPALAKIQDDVSKLRSVFRDILLVTMFCTFVLMIGLAATSNTLVDVLLGPKWKQVTVYLQLLCFVGALYPVHAMNLIILQVKGRSDLFLKVELIKKLIALPTLLIGFFWTIEAMILTMFFASCAAFVLNTVWTKKLINYSGLQQVMDMMPSFVIAVAAALPVYLLGNVTFVHGFWLLVLQIMLGIIIVFTISFVSQHRPYVLLQTLLFRRSTD
jgi:O-antigen/teichoic acid export membrane protein